MGEGVDLEHSKDVFSQRKKPNFSFNMYSLTVGQEKVAKKRPFIRFIHNKFKLSSLYD